MALLSPSSTAQRSPFSQRAGSTGFPGCLPTCVGTRVINLPHRTAMAHRPRHPPQVASMKRGPGEAERSGERGIKVLRRRASARPQCRSPSRERSSPCADRRGRAVWTPPVPHHRSEYVKARCSECGTRDSRTRPWSRQVLLEPWSIGFVPVGGGTVAGETDDLAFRGGYGGPRSPWAYRHRWPRPSASTTRVAWRRDRAKSMRAVTASSQTIAPSGSQRAMESPTVEGVRLP